MHVAPYLAALGILTVIHAIGVIRLRRRFQIGLGDGGIPELEAKIRIFGNHAEYAPMGMIFLMALEWVQSPIWYLHLTGTSLLLGRIFHAIAIDKSRGGSPSRVAGMMLTFASLIFGAIGVVLFSLMPNN